MKFNTEEEGLLATTRNSVKAAEKGRRVVEAQRPSQPAAPRKPAKPKESTPEFIASMAVVIVTGLFIITFVLQAFEIPSSSMENTLLIGDHVFVDRMILAAATRWIDKLIPYRDPKHGDIFVFISPAQPGLYVVKRVIGTPADRIHLQDGVVYRNGERLNEPYVVRKGDYNSYRDNFPSFPAGPYDDVTESWRKNLPANIQNGDLVVPPGYIFAMGDNRDVSLDSRYWGFVPRENVIGRPMFIYWSFVTPRDEYQRHELSDRIAWLFDIVIHFFDKTRWSRMFHVVR
jgi:signal peptidase I